MSDIEDGELSSDDGDECFEEEKKDMKMKLSSDYKINNLYAEYNGYHDTNHIKDQISYGSSDSEDDYMQQNCCNRSERINDRHEYVENTRKRSSEHFESDRSPTSPSSDESDLPQPKRRVLCKYYASGDCQSGKSCLYMHEEFPCKFFHDETSTCRSNGDCKFSHEPLTVEMKKILDDFIQEGKEKLIQSAISTIKNASFINSFSMPQSRPTCLLPTPIVTHSYDPEFSKSYRDISNYPSATYVASSKLLDIIPNYPIANKSQFLQKYSKPALLDLPKDVINVMSRNNHKLSQQIPFNSSTKFLNGFQRTLLYSDHSKDKNSGYMDSGLSFLSNEENIVPNRFPKKIEQLNSKIHAPARFILGNEHTSKIESEEDNSFESFPNYKEALKKLADQIVIEPKRSLEISVDDFEQKLDRNIEPWFDSSHSPKDTQRNENSNIRMDYTQHIFKDDNNMEESEEMYFEKMRNLTNIDSPSDNPCVWNLQRLDPINKQPYLLYVLKLSEIHDNPLADPRLIGHPVLNSLLKKDLSSSISSDEEEYSPLLILKDDEYGNRHFDESE